MNCVYTRAMSFVYTLMIRLSCIHVSCVKCIHGAPSAVYTLFKYTMYTLTYH